MYLALEIQGKQQFQFLFGWTKRISHFPNIHDFLLSLQHTYKHASVLNWPLLVLLDLQLYNIALMLLHILLHIISYLIGTVTD